MVSTQRSPSPILVLSVMLVACTSADIGRSISFAPDGSMPEREEPDVTPEVDAGPSVETPDAGPMLAPDDALAPSPDAGTCTETVTIEGSDAFDDASLLGGICDTDQRANLGGSSRIFLSHAPWHCYWLASGLLRVDVGSIPADARITSATLRLWVIRECSVATGDPDNCGSFTGTWPLTFHPLRRPWSELEVDWHEAADGSGWAAPGATDAAIDHHETPAHVLDVYANEAEVARELDVTESVVAFHQGTMPNHGWLIRVPLLPRPGTRAVDLGSTEAEAPEHRPALVVTYERPCS